jgi:hypothetical protein
MKMDIKNTVIELLTQYSDFKDNDQQLVAWFWKLEMEAHGYPASTPQHKHSSNLWHLGN